MACDSADSRSEKPVAPPGAMASSGCSAVIVSRRGPSRAARRAAAVLAAAAYRVWTSSKAAAAAAFDAPASFGAGGFDGGGFDTSFDDAFAPPPAQTAASEWNPAPLAKGGSFNPDDPFA